MKNEPAFPITGVGFGISRLEFFAAAALTGILVSVLEDADAYEPASHAAHWAFEVAEAMCKESERRLKP